MLGVYTHAVFSRSVIAATAIVTHCSTLPSSQNGLVTCMLWSVATSCRAMHCNVRMPHAAMYRLVAALRFRVLRCPAMYCEVQHCAVLFCTIRCAPTAGPCLLPPLQCLQLFQWGGIYINACCPCAISVYCRHTPSSQYLVATHGGQLLDIPTDCPNTALTMSSSPAFACTGQSEGGGSVAACQPASQPGMTSTIHCSYRH